MWLGPGYGLDGFTTTCQAAQGWQPITTTKGAGAGQGIICGGSAKSGNPQRNSIGFLISTEGQGASYIGLASGSYCSSQGEPVNGAYIGWANADASVVVGSQVCGGQSRFGIFRGKKFSPLPALPRSLPVPAGVMDGTVAWERPLPGQRHVMKFPECRGAGARRYVDPGRTAVRWLARE